MSGRLWFRYVCLSAAGALAVTVLHIPADAALPPTVVPAAMSSSPGDDEAKPDSTSASVAARVLGRRVEDLSQRTETTVVYANPDGSWTSDEASEPVRVETAPGEWHEVDTTLVERNGRIEPRYAVTDLALSDGGERTFAALTTDNRDLSWQWANALPEPTLDGDTATYANVVDGGDLVVTATTTGFTHSIVLNERPIEPIEFTMPVGLDGAQLVESQATGTLTVKAPDGDVIASAPRPLMWDAAEDEGGTPENVAAVDAAVTVTEAGNTRLILSPDDAFLSSPDTEYPVTVDPGYSVYTTGDTWIMNADFSGSQHTSKELRAGTYDAGGHIARSLIKFDVSYLNGRNVTGATLRLRNWDSASCTAGALRAYRVTGNWSLTGVTWANQPAVSSTAYADYSPAHGYTGCAEDNAYWDVTSIVEDWTESGIANYGLRIRGASETSSNTWRKYRSADYTANPVYAPRLITSYNSYPNVPSQPTVSAVGTYAPTESAPVATYVQNVKPTFETTVSDPDKGTVQARFEVSTTPTGAPVSTCSTTAVPSGSRVPCTLATSLSEGGTYYVRATAWDGSRYAGGTSTITSSTAWSSPFKFTVASSVPAAPVVSCPAPFVADSWAATAPGGSVSCIVSATGSGASAPGYINVAVDRNAPRRVRIPQSTDPSIAKTTVTIPTNDGGHGVVATAESPSGKLSEATDYGFGWGNLGMAAPGANEVQTTTDTIAIDASGPPSASGTGTPTATVKWRVAGSGSDYDTGWNEDTDTGLTVTNDATAGVHVTGTWDTRNAATDSSSGGSPIVLDPDRPALLDIQVCVDYPGTQVPGHCTWAADARQVLRVAHAFGGDFPIVDVPGGQVSLWTGELAIGEGDATVVAPGADLSVSRTAASFAGPIPNAASRVFGPGWDASLDGPGTGLGDLTLIDNTLVDGTLQLIDGVGETMIFAQSAASTRRVGSTLAIGEWVALDEGSQLSGIALEVAGSGAALVAIVTEEDGAVTKYGVQSLPTSTTPAVFAVSSIDEAGTDGATSYSHDAAGRVTRMMAPAPAGVTCPATGALPIGCRALTITYATLTTATESVAGDVDGQVKSIQQVVGGSPSRTTELATFKYDSSMRLVTATDGRNGLSTAYSYDGSSDRIASVKSAGLEPVNYVYADDSHKVLRVTRPRPATDAAGGLATLATIVYDIPTHDHEGLPELDQSTVAVWGQTQVPAFGAAVFGADQPFESAGADVGIEDVDAASSGGGAWVSAQLSYTDEDGREVNTAEFGAGEWQFTATRYDEYDNPVLILDARDIAAIRAGDLLANQAGELTTFNEEIKDAVGEVVLPAGSVATDTYSTARWIRTTDGSLAWARPHTHTDYDEGAPNGGVNPGTDLRYALPTTSIVDAVDPSSFNVVDTYSKVTTGYSNAIPSDAEAGWLLGLAATTTIVMAGSLGSTTDIVSESRYDAAGRTTQIRQPKSNGADAGTRHIYYYTAGTHPSVASCGDRPEWAGATCQTSFAGTSPTLLTTTVTSYDDQLNPLISVESAGAVTRTTTNTYRSDGRPTGSSVSSTSLTGSTPIGAKTYGYDADTGLMTTRSIAAEGGNPGGTITTGYDSWGRQISYTPASGETTATNYNSSGNVSEVIDPKGTTSYSYDGTDAAGESERRGLLTKLRISRPLSSDVEITGAYDASGSLTMQKLPGGITQRAVYDVAGEVVGLSYSGTASIIDPDTGEITGSDPDAPWIAWSQDNDALGRVRRDWTPSGAGWSGGLPGAAAAGYSRDYAYDRAARLARVTDRSVPVAGGGAINPDDASTLQALTACQQREYAFDLNGNRTGLTTTTASAGAACPSPGGAGAVAKSWAYDAGDRLVTGAGGGAYVYDAFGRVTTLPENDTPLAVGGGTPGDVGLAYYDNDSVKSLAQGGMTTTFGLDAAGRRSTSVATPSTGSTTTVERHYTDQSDNPGWTKTTTGTGPVVLERFGESLDGSLGLIINGTDVSISVVDLHADAVSQIDVPSSGVATGLAGWHETDEYGRTITAANVGKTPTNPTGADGGIGYGGLGGAQRATDDTGLVLMGVRVYNPTTGNFTSVDPISGGNTSAYAYPQDPVNNSDTNGTCVPICLIPIGIGIYELVAAAAVVIAGVAIIATTSQMVNGFRIPAPNKRLKNKKRKNYYVYQIKYRKSARDRHWYIWKYGITGRPNPEFRPKSQLRACQARSGSPYNCIYQFRAKRVTHYNARLIEFNLILTYTKRWGHCPPGHSNRSKVCI